MNVLAIETSSPRLSVAVRRRDGRVRERNCEHGLRHAENLIHSIQLVLKLLHLKQNELDLIACGVGPGSFTGLRIGLATVKGLAVSLKVRVLGVSSMDLIALNLPIREGRVAVALDARREALYSSFYRFSNGVPKKERRDALFSFDDWCQRMTPETKMVGDAIKSYGSRARGSLGTVDFLDERLWHPRATSIFKWIDQRRNQLPYFKQLDEVKPLYLRLSEAEERRRSRRKS